MQFTVIKSPMDVSFSTVNSEERRLCDCALYTKRKTNGFCKILFREPKAHREIHSDLLQEQ